MLKTTGPLLNPPCYCFNIQTWRLLIKFSTNQTSSLTIFQVLSAPNHFYQPPNLTIPIFADFAI